MACKHTIHKVQEFAKNKGAECLESCYINYTTPMKFRCNTCSKIFEQTFKKALKNITFCPYCFRHTRYSLDEVREIILGRGGKCLSNNYINNKQKLLLKCNKCMNTWKSTFKDIIVSNNWCPYCAGRHNNSLEVARKIAKERNGSCLSTVYNNNKTNMKWKCNKCSHIWYARLDRIKTGTWCPKCNTSHGERQICKYLDRHKISYQIEKRLNNEKNQRFDVYIPSHNLAIEFDGIQHFQIYRRYTPTEVSLKKKHKLDIEKTLFCIKNKIRLLRIAYKDFKYIDDILEYAINDNNLLIFSDIKLYGFIIDSLPINYIFTVLM